MWLSLHSWVCWNHHLCHFCFLLTFLWHWLFLTFCPVTAEMPRSRPWWGSGVHVEREYSSVFALLILWDDLSDYPSFMRFSPLMMLSYGFSPFFLCFFPVFFKELCFSLLPPKFSSWLPFLTTQSCWAILTSTPTPTSFSQHQKQKDFRFLIVWSKY
jgi:hypothetical protein